MFHIIHETLPNFDTPRPSVVQALLLELRVNFFRFESFKEGRLLSFNTYGLLINTSIQQTVAQRQRFI